MRTQPCGKEVRRGRLLKAVQFKEKADQAREFADRDEEIADTYVVLCVHAGIAASDVICCANLGEHAKGDNHQEAISLLARVDREAARHLGTLLRMKTKSSYGHSAATTEEIKKAGRAAEALVEKARRANAAARV